MCRLLGNDEAKNAACTLQRTLDDIRAEIEKEADKDGAFRRRKDAINNAIKAFNFTLAIRKLPQFLKREKDQSSQ